VKYINLIYGLRDPRNDVYMYVGKTTVGESRPLSHLIKSHNTLVNQWVEELRSYGMLPIVDVLERDIELELLSDRERFFISYYSEMHGQLFNGAPSNIDTIFSPSLLSNEDVKTSLSLLSKPSELYRKFKTMTGFSDDVIGSVIGVTRKTVHNIKRDSDRVGMGTILRLMFFINEGIRPVYEYYYKKSNEFQGNYPDNYEDFLIFCITNLDFCSKWFNAYYIKSTKTQTHSVKNVFKRSKRTIIKNA